MKKTLFISILMITFSTFSFEQLEEVTWSNWQESNIRGIDYRIAYEYYNQLSAKHLWSLEIKNRYQVGKSLRCCLGDYGKTKDQIKDQRIALCIKSNDTEGFSKFFTNTPKNGSVSIYIWDVKDCN